MKILVSVRCPLNEHSRRTLEKAIDKSKKIEDSEIIILHVNLFYLGDKVDKKDLKREIKKHFSDIDANYIVRDGFLVEETIFEESASQGVDMVFIGKTKRGILKRILLSLMGSEANIKKYLEQHLDIDVKVVE